MRSKLSAAVKSEDLQIRNVKEGFKLKNDMECVSILVHQLLFAVLAQSFFYILQPAWQNLQSQIRPKETFKEHDMANIGCSHDGNFSTLRVI